jgi:hypothetical protein
MKTKLLSLIFTTVLFTCTMNAQTKTWDFGNDLTTWPLSAGIGSEQLIVDNLGLFPIPTNTNFGAVTANSTTFSDGFTAVRRFQMNGAGYPSGPFQAMPTQRFLHFDVSGPCTVKVWFKTGSNGTSRTIYVSNGTASIGSETTNSGSNTDNAIVTATYTGAAAKLYVYGDAACNLYKVTVSGATVSTPALSTDNFQSELAVNVLAANKQVSITNIISSTQVDVYNLNGALVKSIKTDVDTSFDLLNAGVYIVNVKSAEGEKSVKVLLK